MIYHGYYHRYQLGGNSIASDALQTCFNWPTDGQVPATYRQCQDTEPAVRKQLKAVTESCVLTASSPVLWRIFAAILMQDSLSPAGLSIGVSIMPSSVFCGSLSADGKLAATGGEDDMAYVWDTVSAKIILECKGHIDSIIFAGFNHDDTYLATGDMSGNIKVWKLSDKQVVWEFDMGDATGAVDEGVQKYLFKFGVIWFNNLRMACGQNLHVIFVGKLILTRHPVLYYADFVGVRRRLSNALNGGNHRPLFVNQCIELKKRNLF